MDKAKARRDELSKAVTELEKDYEKLANVLMQMKNQILMKQGAIKELDALINPEETEE